MMWGQCGHSSDCTILAIICVPGTSDPPRRYTLPSGDPLFASTDAAASYRSDRGGEPIRLFDQPASLRLIVRPYQSPSAARTAAG
ncbi:hypothetical protein TNCV_2331371 [Trichonephila clavipes]|nr:hypothetical protein TNCV_2331371 [Trichonephila clavipes]